MAKKEFELTSPALAFITKTAEQPTTTKNTSGEENKSQRVQLLMKPSTVADLDKIATMQRISRNELINDICAAYAAQHGDLIAKYDETFN
ncbi:MAG: hypothetical protein MJ196_11620 [Treponemataceae bacterium]|nr:hypothetical protein [Treponemataceae bacterium]